MILHVANSSYYLIDEDIVDAGQTNIALQNVPCFSEPRTGYLRDIDNVTPAVYQLLWDALEKRNIFPINKPEGYAYGRYFPEFDRATGGNLTIICHAWSVEDKDDWRETLPTHLAFPMKLSTWTRNWGKFVLTWQQLYSEVDGYVARHGQPEGGFMLLELPAIPKHTICFQRDNDLLYFMSDRQFDPDLTWVQAIDSIPLDAFILWTDNKGRVVRLSDIQATPKNHCSPDPLKNTWQYNKATGALTRSYDKWHVIEKGRES